MRHEIHVQYKHVLLRPLRESDLECLRMWRNDKKYNAFLKDIGEVTPQMQMNWFKSECDDKYSYTFAIEEIQELNRLVGSVAIYDIHDDIASSGKIVVGDKEASGRKIGYYGLILAMYAGYQKLGINKYVADVHEDNKPAYINDLRMGFVITGRHPYVAGGYEAEIELTRERFWETHDFLDEIKIF